MSCYNSTVPSSLPQNVMVTSVDPASLMVSWQLPLEIGRNGIIASYVIQYTNVVSSVMMSVNVNSGTTHIRSGLVAYVMYSVRVAAVNVNGTGVFSDPMMQLSGQDSELIKYIVTEFFIHILTPHSHYSFTRVEHAGRLGIDCSVNRSNRAEPGPAGTTKQGRLAQVDSS